MADTRWSDNLFSVRGRLLMAFLGICALAGVSAGVTLVSFDAFRHVLIDVTQERAPAANAALALSRQAERIAAAGPLLLSQSGMGTGAVSVDIRGQIDQLKAQLSHLEDKRFTHDSLYDINLLVSLISQNLVEFEAVLKTGEKTHRRTLQMQRDFSALLVRLQRPLFPAMVLLDSKVAQLSRISDSASSASFAALAAELGQLQRVEKIMLETTSISDKLNALVTESSEEHLDIVVFPLKRSIDKIAHNISLLNDPYRSELDFLFPEFRGYIEGQASLPVARKAELENAAYGEALLASNRELSGKLTVAVDQLVDFAQAEINAATREALNAQHLAKNVVITVLVLTLVSSLLIVWFFVEKNLIRRINALSHTTLAIASGNLDQPLPPTGHDELGKMAGALAVFRDTARVVKENNLRELREARDQAEQASRMKSEFLANMSHELRTPLNAIIGITEMLLEDARDQPNSDIDAPLERVSTAGKKLLRMINELLDLAKIESGKMALDPDHTDIYNVVYEVVEEARQRLNENNNEIAFHIGSDLESLYVDPERFRQILVNLVSNACKFTHNGKITLNVDRDRDADNREVALIKVSDNGIGIEAAYLPDIFREFTQSDGSSTRRYGGTGLGLAISQRLSRIMGGGISVKSALGKGSEFTLKLPLNGGDS